MKFKTIFITGASAGIGESCAEVFAEAGARLILLARRREKLVNLSARLLKMYGTETFSIECDVRNYKTVEKVINNLPDEWKNIDVLINNAGLARGIERIQEGVLENWEEMIDTNIKGLLYVTRLILPEMIKRGEGHIVNVASLAGRFVYPGGNVYCATKYAVKALSEGMLIDLNGTNIRVTNIDPGLVETEFSEVRFHGDTERAKKIYEGYTPLTGRDIAEIILFTVSRPKHVMIQDILVTPTDQVNPYILNKKS